ncbi:MAG: hypothetical protein CGW95_03205 [Phenylobacterium zucineum]|nr:MAG: hypothetical protein CGW95_03205 [Phenylobacterium zucineum]
MRGAVKVAGAILPGFAMVAASKGEGAAPSNSVQVKARRAAWFMVISQPTVFAFGMPSQWSG